MTIYHECLICDRLYTTRSSLRRHFDSDMHQWNEENPEHYILDTFGKDVGGIVIEFAWGKNTKGLFNLIALGHIWKAENMIRCNELYPIYMGTPEGLTSKDILETIIYEEDKQPEEEDFDIPTFITPFYKRELKFNYFGGISRRGTIYSGQFKLDIEYDMDKIWNKCTAGLKTYIYVPFTILAHAKFTFLITNIKKNNNILLIDDGHFKGF